MTILLIKNMEIPYNMTNLTGRKTYVGGSTATGKTTYVKRVINKIILNSPDHRISIFTDYPSEYDVNTYDYCGHYDSEFLQTLVANNNRQPHTIVVDELDILDSNAIKTIFYNGRNLNISIIIISSFPNLPPALRADLDYVVLFRARTQILKDRYYQYFGNGSTKTEFLNNLETSTEYGALVLTMNNLHLTFTPYTTSVRPIINSLHLTETAPNSNSECNECAICLESTVRKVFTICNHSFCRECIETWYRTHNTCPLCRRLI